MSGLEENPFGDSVVENPFADPAIQKATNDTTNLHLDDLDGYNPFEKEQQNIRLPSATNLAVVQPNVQNLPSSSLQLTNQELQRRQEELERKAAELDRREEQLQGHVPHLNNWPPLPSGFCIKPCFYQDFNLEIPSDFQTIVRHLYYVWMFYTLTMLCNILGGLIILIHRGNFSTFGLAIFYAVIFSPASYICWFRPAYKAFRNDSSFNFMVFFFVYFFQTVFSVFQAVGIPGTGYCGFILAISQFDSTAGGILTGIFCVLIALCFTFTAAANVLMITKIHTIYRSSGASMAKAQAEFTSEFIRNQHIQEATSSAVNTAINNQFSNVRY